MTYPLGSIILIKNYKLPTEEKDKFFIVIDKRDYEYNLLSMTTSKYYFNPNEIKHGVIHQNSSASMYCFEKNKVIGINGFSFHKHTFIYHNSNIHQFGFEKLGAYTVEMKDVLINKEFQSLIYSFYKYKGTPKKYISILESVLDKICR